MKPIKIFKTEFPTFVSWQVVFLGSSVWDKPRHDFRCNARESNFNSSCHGKSGVQGSPGAQKSLALTDLCLWHSGQLQGPPGSPLNRVAGVNLENEKHPGADEDGAGLESLKASLVRPAMCLPAVTCKALPETLLVSGLFSLLPFPLVL